MTVFRVALLDVLVLATVAGCGPAADQGGPPEDKAEMQLVTDNALSANGLNPNGLYANGLNPNGLAPTALNLNSLSPKVLAAIQDPGEAGALSRMLLQYTVGCALTTSQSFSFSWTDSENVVHDERYAGFLGLAPKWATGPLDSRGQQMVSACLAARTNYSGVQVIISMRSPQEPLKTLSSAELAMYGDVEGGFWGNLFAPTPYLSACFKASTVDNSRAWLRDCAAGHLNTDGTVSQCGMIQIVGACEAYCKVPTSAGYYPECIDPVHDKTPHVVTTALQ